MTIDQKRFDNLSNVVETHLQKLAVEKERFHELYSELEDNDNPSRDWRLTENMANRLHNFYTGVEHIFQRIAKDIDENVPAGDDWHKQLLRQMRQSTNNRPPVITETLSRNLTEYLRFRHLDRQAYGVDLKWEKMTNLIDQFDAVHQETVNAIETFMSKIDPVE